MTYKSPITNTEIKKVLKNLSVQDFKDFGMHQIAYIRPISNGNTTSYSVHSADGEKISIMDTLDQAIIATRQNELEPVTLH